MAEQLCPVCSCTIIPDKAYEKERVLNRVWLNLSQAGAEILGYIFCWEPVAVFEEGFDHS